ncbi:MAG: hypothetical protein ABH859_02705 [Pseudomonadota bacterium]
MTNIIIKNLKNSEEKRTFLDGSKRAMVVLKTAAIGQGEYLPGWKWSKHVGAQTGKASEAHIGYIISGQMIVQSPDGKQATVGPGDGFELGPEHDAWVIGNEPCIALDFYHLG